VEIAAYTSQVSGLEVLPWVPVYGEPAGTVVFSARVDSLAAMGAVEEKLLADPGYLQRVAVANGRFYTAPVTDQITEFVGMAGSGGGARQFATIITAQAAPGKIAESMAWAVDMMNEVSKLTHQDVVLVRGLYGPWATLGWITGADSLADIDAAGAALSADPGYVDKLDQGGHLFVTGSASSRLIRRLA